MDASLTLVELIRELIREEIQNQDTTAICQIVSTNIDGTVNIHVLPDFETVIPNIINASKYAFDSGDMAVLYKIKNKLNNAFIIGAYNP